MPAELQGSGNVALKLVGVAPGTTFIWNDFISYAIGLALVAAVDFSVLDRQSVGAES